MLSGNRRPPCAKAAVRILVLNLALGCHAYEPQGRAQPARGTQVRAQFANARPVLVRFADGDSTTRTVRSLKGRVSAFDGDTLRLYDLRMSGGSPDAPIILATKWKEGRVALPVAGSEVEVERFQPVRTGLAIGGGVITGLMLLLALAWSTDP